MQDMSFFHNMKHFRFTIIKMFGIACCGFVILSNLSFGQAISIAPHTPSAIAKECAGEEKMSVHHFGWSVGIASGDINLGYDFGDIILSANYAYRLNSTSEIEISLSYIPVQRLRNIDGTIFFKDSSRFMSLTWQTDITWFFHPMQEGFLKNFRFGIGPSLRQLNAMGTNNTNPQLVGPGMMTISSVPFRRMAFIETTSLGMQISAEYMLVQAESIDIILRGRFYAYFPPIASNGVDWIFTNGNGNLGTLTILFRLGW